MTDLNKPGSGKDLIKKVQMHPGLASKNATRQQQLAVYRQQQKNQSKAK